MRQGIASMTIRMSRTPSLTAYLSEGGGNHSHRLERPLHQGRPRQPAQGNANPLRDACYIGCMGYESIRNVAHGFPQAPPYQIALLRTSSAIIAMNSSSGFAFRSSPVRLRTATAPASISRSPMMSM